MDNVLNALNYIQSFISGEYNITKFNSSTKETICGFDGFIGVRYNSSSKISDYTVQLGDFTSYNKVIQPTVIEITLCTEGTYDKISSVLSTLENYKNSTELVDIQTPYGIYIGYNIIDLNFDLSIQKGVGYLECTIKVRQVEISNAQFTAFRNIEEQPTTLLGRINLVRGAVEKVEKITTIISSTLLGTEIIFSNKIKWR